MGLKELRSRTRRENELIRPHRPDRVGDRTLAIVSDRTITFGERLIMARDAGDPGGVPVVYFHGSPGSRLDVQIAEEQAETDDIRLISFDRPGYGGSGPAPFGLRQVALDAARIADRLGIDTFATLGWSGGGPFALAAAAVLGTRVTQVGVACGPGPFQQVDGALDSLDKASRDALALLPEDPEQAVEAFSVGSELLLSVRDDEATFMAGMDALFGDADRHVLADPVKRHHLFLTLREGLTQGFIGVGRDNVAWVGPWDVDLGAVRCPVHLWYGDADQSVPASHGEWLAGHLHDATLAVEPGAGHLWPLQRLRSLLNTVAATT